MTARSAARVLLGGFVGALAFGLPHAACGQGPAPGAPTASGVEVRAWVNRTAMWVGDRVTYTIEVRCPKGTHILEADVSSDKLRLEGFEVLESQAETVAAGDEATLHRVRHTLTTFAVDRPTLRVAPFTLRYYARRAGQRIEDAAPAGEVPVPGAVVALRSVLPDDPAGLALRDGRAAQARPLAFRLAQPVGLGLVLASMVPALVWVGGSVRRWWQRPARRVARRARREERGSLEAVRALDLTSIDGRRAAYDGIETVVRRHLQDVCGIDAAGLTSAELAEALSGQPSAVSADAVRALVAECERARYAPPHLVPAGEACRTAIDQASQLVSRR